MILDSSPAIHNHFRTEWEEHKDDPEVILPPPSHITPRNLLLQTWNIAGSSSKIHELRSLITKHSQHTALIALQEPNHFTYLPGYKAIRLKTTCHSAIYVLSTIKHMELHVSDNIVMVLLTQLPVPLICVSLYLPYPTHDRNATIKQLKTLWKLHNFKDHATVLLGDTNCKIQPDGSFKPKIWDTFLNTHNLYVTRRDNELTKHTWFRPYNNTHHSSNIDYIYTNTLDTYHSGVLYRIRPLSIVLMVPFTGVETGYHQTTHQ